MVKKKKTKKQGLKLKGLEYQVNIIFDPRDDIYVARVPELENCHTHGSTPEAALANAREAIELWMETAKRKRLPIPEPVTRRKFSGKFVLRAPVALHSELAKEALRQGKSMNEVAVELLSDGLKKAG